MSARDAAREQWSTVPAGTHHADASDGTPEFFEQMTCSRYREQPWHRELLHEFAPTGRLLEIGCGAGTDHYELAQMAEMTIGIDLAEHGAGLTMGRLKLAGLPGFALVADGEDLPFVDAEFDAVYSFGVIHHTDHPESVAAEMRRVMKPDAQFMVALYHRWSLFAAEKAARYLLTARWARGVPWKTYLAGLEYGADDMATPPLVRLYSRRSARRLFAEFHDVDTRVVHPSAVGRLFGRWAEPFGWYVVVTGRR